MGGRAGGSALSLAGSGWKNKTANISDAVITAQNKEIFHFPHNW